MKNDTNMQFTKSGLKKLKDELNYRKNTKRIEIRDLLTEARDAGDLSENDGYKLALEDMNANNARIAELEEIIKNAEIIEEGHSTNTVQLGSIVILKVNNKEITYTLVNKLESDPLNNKISTTSPIGEMLIGKHIGDQFSFKTLTGEQTYEIVEIK
jgi:transcription elongation factor GreA